MEGTRVTIRRSRSLVKMTLELAESIIPKSGRVNGRSKRLSQSVSRSYGNNESVAAAAFPKVESYAFSQLFSIAILLSFFSAVRFQSVPRRSGSSSTDRPTDLPRQHQEAAVIWARGCASTLAGFAPVSSAAICLYYKARFKATS